MERKFQQSSRLESTEYRKKVKSNSNPFWDSTNWQKKFQNPQILLQRTGERCQILKAGVEVSDLNKTHECQRSQDRLKIAKLRTTNLSLQIQMETLHERLVACFSSKEQYLGSSRALRKSIARFGDVLKCKSAQIQRNVHKAAGQLKFRGIYLAGSLLQDVRQDELGHYFNIFQSHLELPHRSKCHDVSLEDPFLKHFPLHKSSSATQERQ